MHEEIHLVKSGSFPVRCRKLIVVVKTVANMGPETILITGANRGLGLEFVKQLLKLSPKTLIATCRRPEEAKVSFPLYSVKRMNQDIECLTPTQ